MKRRCLDPTHWNYPKYGARGITIHQPWIVSFDAFAELMGERPSPRHSLDRIDNDGNYEPGNVKWSSREEQMNNVRSNRHLTFRGRTMTMAEWAKELGCDRRVIFTRLKLGWSVEDALGTPLAPRCRTASKK